jgi:hypothetical protein
MDIKEKRRQLLTQAVATLYEITYQTEKKLAEDMRYDAIKLLKDALELDSDSVKRP